MNQRELINTEIVLETAERFLSSLKQPALLEGFEKEIGLLGVYSNFLLRFSGRHPEKLASCLKELERPVTMEDVHEILMANTAEIKEKIELNELMKGLRIARNEALLRITLRDILGYSDIKQSMKELSLMAEAIIQKALEYSLNLCIRRFGEPSDGKSITIIALGKLGAEELNYSSDVDFIAVYNDAEGKTEGIIAPNGLRTNRITNHEFYCKVIEILSRLLSTTTEEGIVYRVDLRLRPQGQRGPLAISLQACKQYYESWGRTWERMVMIRARVIAGNKDTGRAFMEIIRPFVWQRTIDYSEIEEIRSLKKKIDSTFLKDDIKRGYGGIREAEFFIQTLQLIYCKENPGLQTHRMDIAVDALKSQAIVPADELDSIYKNYLYLRRLEHYLQMKDDLQLHVLPKDRDELFLLGQKMGYTNIEDFLSDLKVRRMQIKSMYNTLLGTPEDIHSEALMLVEGELKDEEIKEFLRLRGVNNPERGLKSLRNISERMDLFRTGRLRRLSRDVVPIMIEEALRSLAPDRALIGLETFLSSFGMKEAYLEWLKDQMHICKGLIRMFAGSSYLMRIFLSDHAYLDMLLEESIIRKSYSYMSKQLGRFISSTRGDALSKRLAEFKRFEEFRLGLYYIMEILKTRDLFRYLSHLAEAEINCCLQALEGSKEIVVVGMGKLGGREMTFGSDLDLLMVAEANDVKKAEMVISMLTKYTEKGPPYSIDMRLRPDGTKGTLVKSFEGYKKYYIEDAQQWEVQALLRARPVAGPSEGRLRFFQMVREVIRQRASDFSLEEVRLMREKIVEELSSKDALDIKFGPGGIEEIEFFVQALQIIHSNRVPDLIVQNTITAINRLARYRIIDKQSAIKLTQIYSSYRLIETELRLNEEDTIKEDTISNIIAHRLGYKNLKGLINRVKQMQNEVFEVIKKYS